MRIKKLYCIFRKHFRVRQEPPFPVHWKVHWKTFCSVPVLGISVWSEDSFCFSIPLFQKENILSKVGMSHP